MTAAIYTLYLLNCGFLVLVVLLQAGRGGGAFLGGGGGDQAVFGASGGANFLQKLTVASAVLFMTLSMVLAHMSSRPTSIASGVIESEEETISGAEGEGPVMGDSEAPPEEGSGE